MNNRVTLGSLLIFVLLSGLLAAGLTGSSSSKTWMVVNSQHYSDVMGGAIYAEEMGYSYAFVLTPAQGDYILNFLQSSSDPILYYESDAPVSGTLGASFTAAGKTNVQMVTNNAGLSDWFASHSPSKFAVVVGLDIGAEAVSIAPYVELQNGGLYFTTPSAVASKVSALQGAGQQVMVYGSVAGRGSYSGAEVINGGSVYSDNLAALSKYWTAAPDTTQVMVLSGRTFEKSMPMYPVALVGRTEASPELISWLKHSGVTRLLVLQGDADIGQPDANGELRGAMASLKAASGLPIFAKLSEGFPGDAQVKPLSVLALPGPSLSLQVDHVSYDAASKSFSIRVDNQGNVPVYVRVSASLPGGPSASSASVPLSVGQTQSVSIPLDASSFAHSGQIAVVSFLVASGAQPGWLDAIDVVNFTSFSVVGAPNAAPSAPVPGTTPPLSYPASAPAGAPLGFDTTVALIVLVIALAGAYLYTNGGKKKK